jgi:hypothetical protein
MTDKQKKPKNLTRVKVSDVGELAIIEWHDATADASRWLSADEVMQLTSVFRSVGWVHAVNDTYVWLASDIELTNDDEQHGRCGSIVQGAIRSVRFVDRQE